MKSLINSVCGFLNNLISLLLTGIRRPGMFKTLAIAALALLTAGYAGPAKADLNWMVTPNVSYGNYDPGHPRNESIFSYLVQNTSSPGDANNLISFTLTAPADMQIFDYELPEGWNYEINGNSMTFNGNGNYIPPGNQDFFRVYSYHLSSAQGTANATAVGTGEFPNQPFPQLNDISVPSAIPEPSTLSLLLLGGGGYILARRKKAIRTY